uniref:Uncharacterized protein n=1 Tax=Capra hircus TaxID=9925 RepID=A0A452DNC6_CAPHI
QLIWKKTPPKVQSVQLANFLSVPLEDRAEKWPEASLPGSAAVSRLRFYYIWFS